MSKELLLIKYLERLYIVYCSLILRRVFAHSSRFCDVEVKVDRPVVEIRSL